MHFRDEPVFVVGLADPAFLHLVHLVEEIQHETVLHLRDLQALGLLGALDELVLRPDAVLLVAELVEQVRVYHEVVEEPVRDPFVFDFAFTADVQQHPGLECRLAYVVAQFLALCVLFQELRIQTLIELSVFLNNT